MDLHEVKELKCTGTEATKIVLKQYLPIDSILAIKRNLYDLKDIGQVMTEKGKYRDP